MTSIITAGCLHGPAAYTSRDLTQKSLIRSTPQNQNSLTKSPWKRANCQNKYALVTNLRSNTFKCYASAPTSSSIPTTVADTPVIIWFKHDLRIDDHPGLHQALATSTSIIPVFCFDPRRYEQIVHSTSSAAALSRAVTSLKSSLQSLGSDLIISSGSWEEQLPKIVATVGATAVITEEELEKDWKDGLDAAAAAAAVASSSSPGSSNGNSKNSSVKFHTWNTSLFDTYTPEKFTEWKKVRTPVSSLPPLDPPTSLPPLPSNILDALSSSSFGLNIGLPPPLEILNQVQDSTLATTDAAFAEFVKKHTSPGGEQLPAWAASTSSVDLEEESKNSTGNKDGHRVADEVIEKLSGEASISETIAEVENELSTSSSNGNNAGKKNINTSSITQENGSSSSSGIITNNNNSSSDWGAELAAELAAGEGPVMQALNTYLRHVETSGDGGGTTWQWKLGAAIGKFDIPAAPDGCFPALFNRAMSLGVVSRRRIYAEAMELLEKQKNEGYMPSPPGILAKLGWLLTSSGGACVLRKRQRKATAAAAAAEAGDFHAALARSREGVVLHNGATLRHWRWRGILTDYLVAAPEKPLPGAPAVLLVHGFGAFSEHWRDNVAALASQGYTVYAPTLPGYGRSEKPAIPYGQDAWRDFLADFVLQVVREPVVVAGNSIGGFIAASVAADYPKTVAAVVLVNSAGLLKEGYRPPETPPAAPSPPLFIVEGVSRALFAFLQGDITNQLRRVYPVVPDRADTWLGQEIGRASADPGALGVFRSVFYLPKPRALNYLVSEAFRGPVLVLQGAKDPLNDAVGRAKEIERLCRNAQVVMLDAGHCPHDEKPEEFNEKFAAFLREKFGVAAGEKEGASVKGAAEPAGR